MQVEQLLPAAAVVFIRGVLSCPSRHGTVRGHGRGRLSGQRREENTGLNGPETSRKATRGVAASKEMLKRYAWPQLGLGQGQLSQESAVHGQTWVVMIRACQNTWGNKNPVRAYIHLVFCPYAALLSWLTGSKLRRLCRPPAVTAARAPGSAWSRAPLLCYPYSSNTKESVVA